MLTVLFYSFKRSHHTFGIFNFSLNFSPLFPFKKKNLNLQPTKIRYILRCVLLLTFIKILTFIRDVCGSTIFFFKGPSSLIAEFYTYYCKNPFLGVCCIHLDALRCSCIFKNYTWGLSLVVFLLNITYDICYTDFCLFCII